jgi:hypothetical protein
MNIKTDKLSNLNMTKVLIPHFLQINVHELQLDTVLA